MDPINEWVEPGPCRKVSSIHKKIIQTINGTWEWPCHFKCRNEYKVWKGHVRAQGRDSGSDLHLPSESLTVKTRDSLFHYTSEIWVTKKEKESVTDPTAHSNSEEKKKKTHKWLFFLVHFLTPHCAWDGPYPSSQQYKERQGSHTLWHRQQHEEGLVAQQPYPS